MNDLREAKGDELDLTGEKGSGADGSVPEPSTVPFNSDQDRERIRGYVALILIGLLAVVIVGSFVGLATGWTSMADLEKWLTIIVGPLVALVGAATGFYFGGKK
jgi:hypothetical protein